MVSASLYAPIPGRQVVTKQLSSTQVPTIDTLMPTSKEVDSHLLLTINEGLQCRSWKETGRMKWNELLAAKV
jgi:hypothetical protein